MSVSPQFALAMILIPLSPSLSPHHPFSVTHLLISNLMAVDVVSFRKHCHAHMATALGLVTIWMTIALL